MIQKLIKHCSERPSCVLAESLRIRFEVEHCRQGRHYPAPSWFPLVPSSTRSTLGEMPSWGSGGRGGRGKLGGKGKLRQEARITHRASSTTRSSRFTVSDFFGHKFEGATPLLAQTINTLRFTRIM